MVEGERKESSALVAGGTGGLERGSADCTLRDRRSSRWKVPHWDHIGGARAHVNTSFKAALLCHKEE